MTSVLHVRVAPDSMCCDAGTRTDEVWLYSAFHFQPPPPHPLPAIPGSPRWLHHNGLNACAQTCQLLPSDERLIGVDGLSEMSLQVRPAVPELSGRGGGVAMKSRTVCPVRAVCVSCESDMFKEGEGGGRKAQSRSDSVPLHVLQATNLKSATCVYAFRYSFMPGGSTSCFLFSSRRRPLTSATGAMLQAGHEVTIYSAHLSLVVRLLNLLRIRCTAHLLWRHSAPARPGRKVPSHHPAQAVAKH